jgi:hypothetical protein
MIRENKNHAEAAESKIGDSRAAILVPILLFLIAVYFVMRLRTHRARAAESKSDSQSAPRSTSCPNPNCIRCQRYRQVQSSARTRMPWVARQVRQNYPDESLDRVCDSIQHPQRHCRTIQAPTVLMVRDLPSQEVVTDVHNMSSLTQHFPGEAGNEFVNAILLELSGVPHELWNRNDTPTGSWEVLPLLNQGQWNHSVSRICPRLYHLVSNMPNLLDDCLFGNAMISKIYPGTCIEPHCGPTNARHRLQYTLHVPDQPSSKEKPFLRVGSDSQLSWREPGDFFVFDDSFVHSVHYDDQDSVSSPAWSSSYNIAEQTINHRMVLIVDLWHPDLKQGERTLIRYMYPPFRSRKISQESDGDAKKVK